jgi:hypothetical protein
VTGTIEALTVVARVRAGEADAAREAIARWWGAGPSPFATVPGTHLARLQVLRPPRRRWPRGPADYVLLAADVDPPLGRWLTSLCAHAGPALDAVLSHCARYPGASDPAVLARWIAANRLPVGFSVVAAPRRTVAETAEALALQQRLAAFAQRVQGLGPADLHAAWRAEFGE